MKHTKPGRFMFDIFSEIKKRDRENKGLGILGSENEKSIQDDGGECSYKVHKPNYERYGSPSKQVFKSHYTPVEINGVTECAYVSNSRNSLNSNKSSTLSVDSFKNSTRVESGRVQINNTVIFDAEHHGNEQKIPKISGNHNNGVECVNVSQNMMGASSTRYRQLGNPIHNTDSGNTNNPYKYCISPKLISEHNISWNPISIQFLSRGTYIQRCIFCSVHLANPKFSQDFGIHNDQNFSPIKFQQNMDFGCLYTDVAKTIFLHLFIVTVTVLLPYFYMSVVFGGIIGGLISSIVLGLLFNRSRFSKNRTDINLGVKIVGEDGNQISKNISNNNNIYKEVDVAESGFVGNGQNINYLNKYYQYYSDSENKDSVKDMNNARMSPHSDLDIEEMKERLRKTKKSKAISVVLVILLCVLSAIYIMFCFSKFKSRGGDIFLEKRIYPREYKLSVMYGETLTDACKISSRDKNLENSEMKQNEIVFNMCKNLGSLTNSKPKTLIIRKNISKKTRKHSSYSEKIETDKSQNSYPYRLDADKSQNSYPYKLSSSKTKSIAPIPNILGLQTHTPDSSAYSHKSASILKDPRIPIFESSQSSKSNSVYFVSTGNYTTSQNHPSFPSNPAILPTINSTSSEIPESKVTRTVPENSFVVRGYKTDLLRKMNDEVMSEVLWMERESRTQGI
ncbi:hypothetical protein BB559_002248 [Furculomyces boomerangus]|uniref:Uncharacterized protein n=1 Tax=Furculomyces boomerangus TaxID=61424 RepID=A0A2T9YWR8_9FUNG|nr:hypothetical protein BB559_002248 [Furculomyces boomerangus]